MSRIHSKRTTQLPNYQEGKRKEKKFDQNRKNKIKNKTKEKNKR